jgi:hypothetical protein
MQGALVGGWGGGGILQGAKEAGRGRSVVFLYRRHLRSRFPCFLLLLIFLLLAAELPTLDA